MSTSEDSKDSIINDNLTFDIRSINNNLTNLFQRYSIALNKINGGDILGIDQIRKVENDDGSLVQYNKGRMLFKNDIDKFKYLLKHRNEVAQEIGVTSQELYKNRRNLISVTEYLSRLGGKYELGELNSNMQMYISKRDGNSEMLDSNGDWADYLLTRTWIDKLVNQALVNTDEGHDGSNYSDGKTSDHRIEYLSDMMQEMLQDHILDYHKSLDENFKPELFLDNESQYTDQDEINFQHAYNRLNSFGKLNYCVYDLFKPIGGTQEKHITVKLFSDGTMDISGTVGLDDCTYVPWEHGSPEYLRSLDTGNMRYELKLSIPFNDENSSLWWKPDEPEEIPESSDSTLYDPIEISGGTKYIYYKKYEKERFLRWFGTDHIPEFDMNKICKKTICSIPLLSNDIQIDKIYENPENIINDPDFTKSTVDEQTSLSLLSLATKSTIDLIDREDGQYVVFIVSGHQQTSNISFHIQGKMRNVVQENNHFGNTFEYLNTYALKLNKNIRFLELTSILSPDLEDLWKMTMGDDEYIPQYWVWIKEFIEKTLDNRTDTEKEQDRKKEEDARKNPDERHPEKYNLPKQNVVDLLRIRQIDFESIFKKVQYEVIERYKFIRGMSGLPYDDFKDQIDYLNYLISINKIDVKTRDKILRYYYNIEIWDQNLYTYIKDTTPDNIQENEKILSNVNLSIPLKEQLRSDIKDNWYYFYNCLHPKDGKGSFINYETTVDDIRERIETFNTLIVRLPIKTRDNMVASRHIFWDWMNYINKSLEYLGQDDKKVLFSKEIRPEDYSPQEQMLKDIMCKSTDGQWYPYTEYYIDEEKTIPLIDYSYRYKINDLGFVEIIKDRFDFWRPWDFLLIPEEKEELEKKYGKVRSMSQFPTAWIPWLVP